MRYKEDNDNRYRVNFMRATEELMDALTVESFISYLEENAEFEDYTVEYIDGKCVKCKEAKCTNTAELQEELGVSRRTLRTDIAYLKRVYPDKLITHRGRYTGGLEWVE